jgi:hypothetical protein
MPHLNRHGIRIFNAQFPAQCNGGDHFDKVVRVVGPAGDHNTAGNSTDTARETPGIPKGPAICGKTLNPDPVKRIDLLADWQA